MQQKIDNNHRYKQLDSLRGLAALAVFGGHSIGSIISLKILVKSLQSPLSIFINGNAAVMFFFVLSGFVLSLPYIRGQRPLSLTAFYIKRVFRIYPAFIAAIVLSLGLKAYLFQPHPPETAGLWIQHYWLWDMTPANLKETLRTFLLIAPRINFNLIDPPIWSLAVEMVMALFIPFFIWLVSRCNWLLNIVVSLPLAYLAFSYNKYFIMYAGVFYLGVILAKYKDDIVAMINRSHIAGKILLATVGLFLYNTGMTFLNVRTSAWYPIFDYALPAIGSGLLIILVLASNRLSAFFGHRWFVFMGTISYSFYLIHFPLLLTVSSLLINIVNPYLFVTLTFVLTVALSYVTMRFIEHPFQAMASRLVKRYQFLNMVNVKIK